MPYFHYIEGKSLDYYVPIEQWLFMNPKLNQLHTGSKIDEYYDKTSFETI